jgi:N-methylhydantoinase A
MTPFGTAGPGDGARQRAGDRRRHPLRIAAGAPSARGAAHRSERRIYLDDWVTTPVYDFNALAPAQTISGPAIIESAMTTVLLRPGERATVTALGWLDIVISHAS